MKVSEWLREYQLTGAVPEQGNAEFAFWCGWLVSHARQGLTVSNLDEARQMAIKAAEFIEKEV